MVSPAAFIARPKRPGLTSADLKGGLFAIFKLTNRYFLKSLIGPVLVFGVPILLFGLLYVLFKDARIVSAIVLNVAFIACVTVMPAVVVDLRESSISKIVGASPARKRSFATGMLVYFTMLSTLATAVMMAAAYLICRDDNAFAGLTAWDGMLGFLLAYVLNLAVSLAIGQALSTIARSRLSATVLGILVYFPLSFLSGHFMPVLTYVGAGPIVWIGRLAPIYYLNMMSAQIFYGTGYVKVLGSDGLFVLDEAGAPFKRALDSASPFVIADYRIPTNFEKKFQDADALGFNTTLQAILGNAGNPDRAADAAVYARNIFGGPYVNATGAFNKAEHIVAFAYPFVWIGALLPATVKAFTWKR